MSEMTDRERYRAAMRFKKVDRLPFYPMSLHTDTTANFHEQGLRYVWDIDINTEKAAYTSYNFFPIFRQMDYAKYFGCDRKETIYLDQGPIPRQMPRVQEETDRYIVVKDKAGTVQKVFKGSAKEGLRPYAMPMYVDWPVKTMKDWEKIKALYDPLNPCRYPKDWSDELIEHYETADHPIEIFINGFYAFGRELMGTVPFCMAFYKDPELVHNMMYFHAEFLVELLKKVAETLKSNIDSVMWHEDMCHRHGPNISPRLFREFMLPGYRKVTDLFRKNGIDVIIVDTDGDFRPLIPSYIDAGVSGIYPCEVGPVNLNVVDIRKEYPRVLLLGNIDKRALVRGKEAIEKEIDSKVPYMKKAGGYIPAVDHHVSPDTPLENFLYYLEYLKKTL